MDGDRLRLPANRNCYRLSRVSWALLKLLVLSTHSLLCQKIATSCLSFLTRKFIMLLGRRIAASFWHFCRLAMLQAISVPHYQILCLWLGLSIRCQSMEWKLSVAAVHSARANQRSAISLHCSVLRSSVFPSFCAYATWVWAVFSAVKFCFCQAVVEQFVCHSGKQVLVDTFSWL